VLWIFFSSIFAVRSYRDHQKWLNIPSVISIIILAVETLLVGYMVRDNGIQKTLLMASVIIIYNVICHIVGFVIMTALNYLMPWVISPTTVNVYTFFMGFIGTMTCLFK